MRDTVDAVYRSESRRILATLIRLLGDFDLAEDALHDAFTAALQQWPRDGVPANPRAWLVSAGRFKAIDGIRRRARFDASLATLAEQLDARIPYQVPEPADLPERLETVLQVIYLVFNEGYSASFGGSVTRADLSGEAIRVTRLLIELLPEPEAMGLLALMLLHESRRAARTSPTGDLVLLEDQDRTLWNPELIMEGTVLVRGALATQ